MKLSKIESIELMSSALRRQFQLTLVKLIFR